jgi:hypothetical protein
LAFLKVSLAALLSGTGVEAPRYPLGPLRLPPIAEQARPFRLVDLRYSFTDENGTRSGFDARARAGAGLFIGGEVEGERRGIFLDSQRIEAGLTAENGDYEVEGSFRAPWFLARARASNADDEWSFSAGGSARFSNDLELLFSHSRDLDQTRFTPGLVEDFARTGILPPPGPPRRELRDTSVGLLYQRESHFEALADLRSSQVRTEAGFDLDVDRYRVSTIWNPRRFEIEGEIAHESRSGFSDSDELGAFLGIEAEVGSRVLARASASERWERGLLRYGKEYRFGGAYFARRHRFRRRGEAAERLLALQRRANALGYNERRVYDLEGLRRFRERLGISGARLELKEEIDELYRAQVRDRNVPQLGFTLELAEDKVRTVERRGYRAFVGVPWPLRLPFAPNPEAVQFLELELAVWREDYGGGIRAVSREMTVNAFLNRELSFFFRWQNPGDGPEQVIAERGLPSLFAFGVEYALGR